VLPLLVSGDLASLEEISEREIGRIDAIPRELVRKALFPRASSELGDTSEVVSVYEVVKAPGRSCSDPRPWEAPLAEKDRTPGATESALFLDAEADQAIEEFLKRVSRQPSDTEEESSEGAVEHYRDGKHRPICTNDACAATFTSDYEWEMKINIGFACFSSDITGFHRDGNSELVPDPFLSCTQLPYYAPFAESNGLELKRGYRAARASGAQGVGQGPNHAGRATCDDTIPSNAHNVAARVDFERGSQGDHAAYTRAGRKIHAVERPENALPHPFVLTTTRPVSPCVQSHIDRLPNELLCAIFLLTGDPSPASGFPRDHDMHDTGLYPGA
ncbi:hypothetical protein K525DRAFT_245781, partial [Schizophyllum commune Loenen D]